MIACVLMAFYSTDSIGCGAKRIARGPVPHWTSCALQSRSGNAHRISIHGKSNEAESFADTKTVASPDNPVIEDLRSLYRLGRYEAASVAGWQLLQRDPRDSSVLNLLALAEHRLGNHHAAVVLMRRSIQSDPENYIFWNDLGNIFFNQGDREAAIGAYQKALQLNQQCAESFSNLGALYYKDGEYAAGRNMLEQALAIRPRYPDALYNLGNVLAAMGKYQKAAARYEQAVRLRPEHGSSHFNLGITRLLLGDMKHGWPDWEWRWRSTQAAFQRHFAEPRWTGEMLGGRRILLYAEQGIGDTLQFLRYLDPVAARGGHIVLEVQEPLVTLLQHHPAVETVIAHGKSLPAFDLQCSLMSLGSIFKTTVSTIPPLDSFLKASNRGKTSTPGKPVQVGLVWAGNPAHERDQHRSMSLQALAPLLKVDGVQWHSLQHGSPANQLIEAAIQSPTFAGISNLGSSFHSFADTAQAMHQLDLVITIDTSVAHLAGSIGKPVWIMLPCHPDWRWLLKRRDSPWYPSARLFRQPQPGDWTPVVDAIKSELETLVGG